MYSEERWSEKESEVKAPRTEIGKLLLDAAAYMREHGHAKGTLSDKDGRVCIQGAFNAVLTGNPVIFGPTGKAFEACRAITKHLGLKEDRGYGPGDYCSLMTAISWNNNPKTTKEEIVAGMESTAYAL